MEHHRGARLGDKPVGLGQAVDEVVTVEGVDVPGDPVPPAFQRLPALADVAGRTGGHHVVEVVVFDLFSNSLVCDPDYWFPVIGVPADAQQHAAVGTVSAVLQAHLLALSFLQAHRYPCRFSG